MLSSAHLDVFHQTPFSKGLVAQETLVVFPLLMCLLVPAENWHRGQQLAANTALVLSGTETCIKSKFDFETASWKV